MSITFATGDSIKNKVSSEHDFDFFGGQHPSTLKESDLLIMEMERKKRLEAAEIQRRHGRFHPYPSSGRVSPSVVITPSERREFLTKSVGGARHPPPPAWSGLTLTAKPGTPPPPGLSQSQTLTYEDLTPEEKASIIKATHKTLLDSFAQIRRCINCNANFNELKNVGQRKCVWHPGAQKLCIWSCCEEKSDFVSEVTKRPVGCCECDHTATDFDPLKTNMTEMPLCVARMLGVPEENIIHIQSAENNRRSELHKRCYVTRASQKRVPNRKVYRPPQDWSKMPITDMDMIRDRLEMTPRERVKHYEDPLTVNNYAGHIAPGYHLNY